MHGHHRACVLALHALSVVSCVIYGIGVGWAGITIAALITSAFLFNVFWLSLDPLFEIHLSPSGKTSSFSFLSPSLPFLIYLRRASEKGAEGEGKPEETEK